MDIFWNYTMDEDSITQECHLLIRFTLGSHHSVTYSHIASLHHGDL